MVVEYIVRYALPDYIPTSRCHAENTIYGDLFHKISLTNEHLLT